MHLWIYSVFGVEEKLLKEEKVTIWLLEQNRKKDKKKSGGSFDVTPKEE